MLTYFEGELASFERAERPDYELLSESLAYCRDYLDAWHHPREDWMLELLRAHDREKAAAMSTLGEQHLDLAETTSRVVAIFNDVAQRGAIRLRENLVRSGRDLSRAYRLHLDWEETNLFPVAAATLMPADWKALGDDAARAAMEAHSDRLAMRYPALFGAVEPIA